MLNFGWLLNNGKKNYRENQILNSQVFSCPEVHAMANLAKNRQKVGKNLKDFSRAVPYKVVKLMKWLNVN